jgi:di/tricarboxylate transporter
MADGDAGKGSMLDKMKLTSGIGVVVFILTLAIWIFFDRLDMRLDPIGTTVVATAIAIVAIFGQWLWSRRTRKGIK